MRKIFFLLSFVFSTYAENLEELLERCYPSSNENEDSCAVNIIKYSLGDLVKTLAVNFRSKTAQFKFSDIIWDPTPYRVYARGF